MLRAEKLVLRRGGHDVVADLTLEIVPSEAIMLLGRNGAGKSTLLRALAGLLRPRAGRVCWNGADIREDLPEHGRRLRWVGHLDAAKPSLTVRENLGFLQRLLGGEVQAALDAMALNAIADQPARSLSSGQRRRLALSRLVLGQAPLWLLDEPTVGLDTASVARLEPLIARHRAAGGMVVAATHLPLPVNGAREMVL